ncbi:hypothetical protein [Kribbella sp. NPDC050459]|uniref:hypothetical protein n=1 Tax=Kribbella sp. NPDC050459 TaxID=3155785 RepID=UPI0033E9A725
MPVKGLAPFLVLADAVAEGRLSAGEFMRLCLPLFKYTPGSFESVERFEVAQDLFIVANDFWESPGETPSDLLTAEQVREKAAAIAVRMRSVMAADEERIRLLEAADGD